MRFNVLAVDARQQVIALDLEAASESLAADELRQRGLTPLSLKANGIVFSLKRKAKFNTALFSVELSSLLRAGLNLVEALKTLADKDAQGERREVLSGLLAAIRRGEPFSQAVAGYPRQFPPLYVATVKSAERTGSLREALGRYIAYQEELSRVKKKIVSATIYPAILLAVGALVIGFLVLYVVPRFAQVYADMSATLPFFSRLLLGFGNFVGAYTWAILLLISCVVALACWGLREEKTRAALNRRVWRVPAVGDKMKTYQLARLYRTAGMLMDAGIPALRALGMCRDLLAAHLFVIFFHLLGHRWAAVLERLLGFFADMVAQPQTCRANEHEHRGQQGAEDAGIHGCFSKEEGNLPGRKMHGRWFSIIVSMPAATAAAEAHAGFDPPYGPVWPGR